MTLDAAIKALQAVVGAIEGIRAAPEYAPDRLPPGIFSVALPESGSYIVSPAGVLRGLHNIQLYVICPRVDLPKTLQAIIPLGDTVANELQNDPTIGGAVQVIGAIDYSFSTSINLGSADTPAWYSGWVFSVRDVKIQEPLT